MKAYWHVQCPEHSKFIQKKLFESGYTWSLNNTDVKTQYWSRLSVDRYGDGKMTVGIWCTIEENHFEGADDLTHHPDWCWPRPKEEEKPKLQLQVGKKYLTIGGDVATVLSTFKSKTTGRDVFNVTVGTEGVWLYHADGKWCGEGDNPNYHRHIASELKQEETTTTPKQKELVFEIGREYKTRDGIKVILDFVDEVTPTKYPYRFSGGDGDSFWCYANGLSCVGNGLKDKLDIIDYWEEENKNNLTKEENNGIIPAKEITEERKETKENDNTTTTKGNGNETNTKYSFRY